MSAADLAPARGLIDRVSQAAPVAMGLLLAGITTVALGLLSWYEYYEVLDADRELGALQARVLDDHATRLVDAVSVTLNYLSKQMDNADVFGGNTRADQILTQPLVSLPHVRSLHLVDSNGFVLASSSLTDIGVRIDMARLGTLPVAGRELIGGFVEGRGLASLAFGEAVPVIRRGVGFIPVVRTVPLNDGANFYLVALLNPDSFSSFQLAILDNPAAAAYLLNFQGELLASSTVEGPALGSVFGAHPVFKQYLPKIEFAAFLGSGAMPGRQVVAFRLSKSRPLVVIVEKPYIETLQHWWLAMRWFVGVGLLTVVFIGIMSVAVHRNIRQRRKVNAELSTARADVVRREQELRVLVRSVQEIIFRTNAQGEVIYLNDRWVALRGQTVDSALGLPLKLFVEDAEQAAVQQLFSPDNDAAVRTTTANLRGLGDKLHRFDIAVVPLHDNGVTIGYAGSAVDVTARVEAEQALQRQLAFVALILEVSPLPVATFDAQGRYATVNRAWEDFMGRTRADVIGQRGVFFMSAEDAALHAQRDAELWRNGGTLRYEAKIKHRDGSRRDVVVTKVVLPGDDFHSAGLLSTMIDVSEFRQAERATREAKEAAEESSRAKSEFTANISHELRTPLQSILGFSEMGVAKSKDHPRLQNMFNEIQESGGRMLALVNDLLDISKIESAIGSINLERADLRGLIYPVLRELQPLVDSKQLYIWNELGEVPLIAKVDPVRFQQVIRNVTANAIKFSPVGTEIAVTGSVTDDSRICIRVRDHGVGIPADELESIFEAFVQSSSTKDGSGGTGLGLAICRKIVDAHGGTIEARNMPEGGAVFSIFLPMRHTLEQDSTF